MGVAGATWPPFAISSGLIKCLHFVSEDHLHDPEGIIYLKIQNRQLTCDILSYKSNKTFAQLARPEIKTKEE